ncbi:hypothetical protein, unlikely [Trypanosoma brucei gambiense DAL972]|uniref:Uncharacterized protein n=1 Tax=Trypanosoma brucei gambiense (strain MHOM/CI/86/DAL972) TaxID=679716 RepID=C9ZWD0_TRYB9|nr:hypothetical protein, unlikely [Trypanosoma brucei gambiense DAL972]CBH13719.1 hypothetical protein, unlikely [Trypanosoma brucei gambiense DAL972]|eukprot:XP_011775995.1 hypothetical protein, unlikely [Trypanosoma brucei gambiense DAL972]
MHTPSPVFAWWLQQHDHANKKNTECLKKGRQQGQCQLSSFPYTSFKSNNTEKKYTLTIDLVRTNKAMGVVVLGKNTTGPNFLTASRARKRPFSAPFQMFVYLCVGE